MSRKEKFDLDAKQSFIFDMDGTLVDSMWIWDNLLIDFLAGHGYETPTELLREVAYMSMEQSSKRVCELYDLSMTAEEVNREWTDMIYDGYARKIKTKPGAREYLEYLKRKGKRIALATAGSKEMAELCMRNNEIFEYFDAFVYADEVGEGKSSPKIYLEALSRLNTEPANAVLFEDILEALKTAKKIPLDVVIVEDASAKSDRRELKRQADLYIKDFKKLI